MPIFNAGQHGCPQQLVYTKKCHINTFFAIWLRGWAGGAVATASQAAYYCIECYEIWFGNVFLGVLLCLRFSMWSDELFLQLLNVTFFSQSDHTIGFCEKFPWIWKKNQLSTTNGSEVMAVWSFWSRKGLEGYILIVQKNYYEKHLT